MKYLTPVFLASLSFAIAACSKPEQEQPNTTPPSEVSQSASTHEAHMNHEASTTTAAMGHGIGTIDSIGPNLDSITIDHGPIPAIAMGAMTMGFDTQGDVDLSGFVPGDSVSFMVKKGRDNSYRITDICNTKTDGDECLGSIMKH